jgi:cytochrome c553
MPSGETYRTKDPSMMSRPLLAAVFAAVVAAPAVVQAQAAAPVGNAAAGEKKTQMCAGCHGILGWRTAYPEVYKVPKIGGQHAAYIVKALQEYKSGERTHPSMRAITASLSDQDMADLAAYYSAGAAMTASK